jgi:hypothetical protein
MTSLVAVIAVMLHVNRTKDRRIVVPNVLLRAAASLAVEVLHVLPWEEVLHAVEAEAVAVAVEDNTREIKHTLKQTNTSHYDKEKYICSM